MPYSSKYAGQSFTAYHFDSNVVDTALSDFKDFSDVENDNHEFKTSPTHVMGVGIAKAPITEAILPKIDILRKTVNICSYTCPTFITHYQLVIRSLTGLSQIKNGKSLCKSTRNIHLKTKINLLVVSTVTWTTLTMISLI